MKDDDLLKAVLRRWTDEGLGSGTTEPNPHDLGWLGMIFGGRYASTNIAGVVIVASVLLLVGITFWPPAMEYQREVITGTFSLISLVLGYLFGSTKVRH